MQSGPESVFWSISECLCMYCMCAVVFVVLFIFIYRCVEYVLVSNVHNACVYIFVSILFSTFGHGHDGKSVIENCYWFCISFLVVFIIIIVSSNSDIITIITSLWCVCVCVCAEPYGGVQSLVPNNHHIPLVPELLRHPLPQQEGSAGGENPPLPSSRLLSWVWWWV